MKDKTSISAEVRKVVYERDSIDGAPCCIFCGSPREIEIMHFIPRSRGGKGIEQNLACGCHTCHTMLDQGSDTRQRECLEDMFRYHLEHHYEGWNENDLIVKKGIL